MEKHSDFDAHEIVTGFLYLGSEDAAHCPAEYLKSLGITHILVAGFGIATPHEKLKLFTYKKIKAIDLPVYNILDDFPQCISFITSAKESGGKILVHCARGKSRSAAVVVAYLMASEKISFAEAHQRVRKLRNIAINDAFQKQLLEWGRLEYKLKK